MWSSDDPGTRRELEFRVLAGQGPGKIADRLGLTAAAVVAYERLFFDVRERRGAASFIMGLAIGHNVHDGFAAGDIEAVMKVFAFGYGPVVLDAVIKALGVEDTAGASAVVSSDPALARAARMAIVARSIPVNAKTAPILIRLNARLLEIEREVAAAVALDGPIRVTVEPFPGARLHERDRPMSPVHSPAVGAAIGHDHGRAGPGELAEIAAKSPAPDPIRPGVPIRRTA